MRSVNCSRFLIVAMALALTAGAWAGPTPKADKSVFLESLT